MTEIKSDLSFSARAAIAACMALLIALSVLLAGGASAELSGQNGQSGFGITCVSQPSGVGQDDRGVPTRPHHQHGWCCILHCGAFASTGAVPVAVSVLRPAADPVFLSYDFRANFRIAFPELTPISARAPPHLDI